MARNLLKFDEQTYVIGRLNNVIDNQTHMMIIYNKKESYCMKNNMLSKAFVNMDNHLKMGHNGQGKRSGKWVMQQAALPWTFEKSMALQFVCGYGNTTWGKMEYISHDSVCVRGRRPYCLHKRFQISLRTIQASDQSSNIY